MPGPDRAVDHARRLADHGACVPWGAMAAIERAQADAEARQALGAGPTERRGVRDRIRRLLSRAGRRRQA